ncbi:hypothetical protein [Nostoc sp.]|uniref:hypothetical protein n=1 Tax=Nostoc sp. TaxID=1180 RepID=UPI002FF663F4
MERETSARFSFLLGLPAVILAGVVELHTLTKAGLNTAGWLTLLVGYNLCQDFRFCSNLGTC